MPDELLFRFVEFAVQTAILLVLLWMMVKVQKLGRRFAFKFRGVLGAAALVTGLDMILQRVLGHLSGPYLASCISTPIVFVMLLYCIKKITRTDYVDAFFAVAIPFALMFAVNFFLLGPIRGELRAAVKKADEFVTVLRRREIKAEPQTVTNTNPPTPKTNAPAPRMAPNPVNPELAKPVAGTAPKTNAPVQTTNQPGANAPTNLVVQPAAKPVESMSKYFSVKGVTRNGANSAVTIQTGPKVYTVFLGEAALMQTPDGPISVRFSDLGGDSVTLEINGEQAKFPIP